MIESKPDESSLVLFRWVWRVYIRHHWRWLGLAFILMSIEGSALGALSYMVRPMFDDVFVAGEPGAVWRVGGIMLAIFVFRAAASVFQKAMMSFTSLRMAAHLRQDLLARIMRQDGAFHQSHPPGFLIQRVQTDVEAINNVWQTVITGAGRDAVSLVALLVVAINIDWRWAAVTLIGAPVLLLPVNALQVYVRRQARRARDLGAALSTRLDEIFHGIVPIKLNRLERYQADQFANRQEEFIGAQWRANVASAAIPAMIDLLAGIGLLAVLIYGGGEIMSGEKTLGDFMSFFTAIGLAFDPMRRLAAVVGTWQIAASALERLKELMDAPLRLTSSDRPVAAPRGLPDIDISDVELRYGDATVLNGVSFRAQAGHITALVGASGAGKSTIFNVLTRLVDPQKGSIRIAGTETRDMDLSELRNLFSVVTQDALLFDETLRENILLDRTDVDAQVLQEVLDAASVSDFLDQLPEGLDTPVGPRGSVLSGGQRQRVVIARALLRNAPVLLLDEATSALDSKSEKIVQEALNKLSGGRTTLVIAHRLSTVRNADKIVVMERGQIVAEGTHDALLAAGGIYANLYRLQFQDGKTVIDPEGAAALATSEPR
ncbi:MAG: ABC transporter ATP-binding protein [Rhodobacteraceae bacterium]|nr:ABC transporter ATP-binding protein [Paracoccaceae bacterium]